MQVAFKSARLGAALPRTSGKAVRPVRVAAASGVDRAINVAGAKGADRPLWFPGNPAPAHLDGTLPGDFGFDPLNLGSDPALLKWFVQAELQNARWAMLGVAGILLTSIGAQVGLPFPQWYNAGEVVQKTSPIPFGTLLVIQFVLFHFVETKRAYDLRNPGSQGDGSFFGVTTEFKGKEPGYPGGRFFDPLGMANGPLYEKYKWNEIRNGRLAMVAFAGFAAQTAATGKGPIENLVDHINSPYTTTFATNGVSIPFIPSQ